MIGKFDPLSIATQFAEDSRDYIERQLQDRNTVVLRRVYVGRTYWGDTHPQWTDDLRCPVSPDYATVILDPALSLEDNIQSCARQVARAYSADIDASEIPSLPAVLTEAAQQFAEASRDHIAEMLRGRTRLGLGLVRCDDLPLSWYNSRTRGGPQPHDTDANYADLFLYPDRSLDEHVQACVQSIVHSMRMQHDNAYIAEVLTRGAAEHPERFI